MGISVGSVSRGIGDFFHDVGVGFAVTAEVVTDSLAGDPSDESFDPRVTQDKHGTVAAVTQGAVEVVGGIIALPVIAPLALLGGLSGCSAPESRPEPPTTTAAAPPTPSAPGSGPIPREYFGMHIHPESTNQDFWPTVPFGSWRLWDTGVTWPNLEKNHNNDWRFEERLDGYVKWAQDNNIDLLLPLAHSPSWAASRPHEPSAYKPGWASEPQSMEDWADYVRTVATRYDGKHGKGKINTFEIWNEPDMPNHYSGDIAKLVEMTRIAHTELKKIDPNIKLVSPSFVGEPGLAKLEEFLRSGGKDYVDIIGFHSWDIDKPPETVWSTAKAARELMQRYGVGDKPIWDTETGWAISKNNGAPVDPQKAGFPANTPVLSQDQAQSYILRALVLGRCAGLDRFYWYAWDNGVTGIAENDTRTVKPAAQAYTTAYKWLQNAEVKSCEQTASGAWVVKLARGDAQAWMVWNPSGQNISLPKPSDWQAVSTKNADDTRQAFSGETITAGAKPILVESEAWQRATR